MHKLMKVGMHVMVNLRQNWHLDYFKTVLVYAKKKLHIEISKSLEFLPGKVVDCVSGQAYLCRESR